LFHGIGLRTGEQIGSVKTCRVQCSRPNLFALCQFDC
jgi:hypothetical protein